MNLLRALTGLLVLPGVALLAGCSSDSAAADAASSVTVSAAWVRATTGTDDPSMTAAFMNVDNQSSAAVTLVGASSPVSPMVQLHEMTMQDGSMVMQQMQGGLVIEANRGKSLAPGGNHIMLMGLTTELAAGDEVQLTLEFSDGSTLGLTLPVKEFTEEEPHYHATTLPSADLSMTPSETPAQ